MGSPVGYPPAIVAGRYEIEKELARGGMGFVYRARDRVTGKAIALKRSLIETQTSNANAEIGARPFSLRNEYQTLVTLQHPHIIKVYDFGSDERGPYYTMELLDGTDLGETAPLPWREACRYLRDVASSLALLHSRRLVHSDVSVANVRVTGEGRAKLIDFGTLSSFGRREVIAGTPPTTPPEVLDGRERDHRVDLYALGATAYFALTGRHAYPATMMALLRVLWEASRPAVPSQFAQDIPPELDELVLSLLELDRDARPTSAAEVIDKLDAITGAVPAIDDRVAQSYLLGSDLVGRGEEQACLESHLEQAFQGRGGGSLIDGGYGLGKTALLGELLWKARMAGARTVSVNASLHRDEPNGTWSTLVRETTKVCGSLAEIGEPTVIAVEDLHLADPSSIRSCADFVSTLDGKRLLFVATADLDHAQAADSLALLRERARTVELFPFDARATTAFVHALFGQVPSAARLATFLREHTTGNPRTCAEVVVHLIDRGTIRYVDGAWVLPQDISESDASAVGAAEILDAAFSRRFERWSEPLQALALCMSTHRRMFDAALCRELVAEEPTLHARPLERLLAELVREGVLKIDGELYGFARARTRELLYRQLPDERRRQLHGRLARAIRRLQSAARGFEIGVHFLLAGEADQARVHINEDLYQSLADPDRLLTGTADVWALYEQQREHGSNTDDLTYLEAILAVTGFYRDPILQDRLGLKVLPRLAERSGFALSARLARYLGSTLGLLVGVTIAWLRWLARAKGLVRVPFSHWLALFIGVCAAMGGVASFRLDRSLYPRLLEHLRVAKRLSRRTPLRLVYDLIGVGQLAVEGRLAKAQAGLEDQLERLPKAIGLAAEPRHHYEAGLHFCIGRNLLLSGGDGTLLAAQRMEELGGQQDQVMARFLRRTHYLYRADMATAKREEARLDELLERFGVNHAINLLNVLEFLPYHLSGDVLGLKASLHRVTRLLTIAPALSTYRQVILAMYEGHRGRPARALEIYREIDADLSPFSSPLWAAARGHQAECLNALGRHEQALSVCDAALTHLGEDDLIYVFAYQQLQREAALAHAFMGHLDEGAKRMDALLAQVSEERAPLLWGLLHAERARIACLERDGTAFVLHARAARAAFSRSGCPPLIAKGKRLDESARQAGLAAPSEAPASDFRAAIGQETSDRARRILEEATSLTGARAAGLYLSLGNRCLLCARHGELSSKLSSEISQVTSDLQLHAERAAERLSLLAAGDAALTTEVVPLLTTAAGRKDVVGVLVLIDCSTPSAVGALPLEAFVAALDDSGEMTELG